MEKFYFVMPAFNEAENIRDTIRQWYSVVEKINKQEDCEAVLAIANDGSKDNTYDVMLQMKASGHLKFFEPLTKSNGGMGRHCFIYIAMLLKMVLTTYFRQIQMDRLILKSFGKCLNIDMIMIFR